MDYRSDLLSRHQDLLERERIFNELLDRLPATSIPNSVRATSIALHATAPLVPAVSRRKLLERELALKRMGEQLMTSMSTS